MTRSEGPAAQDLPVLYRVDGPTATITLNNPAGRNVLTPQSMALLKAHLAAAGSDEAVRVVVLTGAGNTFCAGADLRAAQGGDEESFAASGPTALVDVLNALMECPKPVVAAVQGHVAGGGNGLVAAADIAVAAESAKFAFSEVRVGVAPAVISVVCMEKMNRADAFELLLTGGRVSAQRVLEAGLVNRVVPDEALHGAVEGFVAALVAGGPQALAATKRLLRGVPDMTRQQAFEWTAALSAQLFSSPEAQEGMAAFIQRRPAAWLPQD